jgi:two-component system alkaline phosphatase synthesis response regulator PhoP
VSPRILLIEDEATLSLLLRERFEREGYAVTTCQDGETGLLQAISGGFELLVLDVRLPGKNGFAVCRELRRHGINLPVLMLTARGDVQDRVKGLKLGADDYLTKPFEVAELLARMEALLRRANNTPPQLIDSVFCFGDVIVDLGRTEVLRNGAPLQLTAKEFGLLRYFIAHPGERLTRGVLLEHVWGYKQLLNTRTVDLHVAQLRQKLEVNPREPRHILTAFGSGYKFLPFP